MAHKKEQISCSCSSSGKCCWHGMYGHVQHKEDCAKRVVCDNPGLVGFMIRLASSVLNLPDWQVEVLWKYNYSGTLRHII